MTELAKGTYKPTNNTTLKDYTEYWFDAAIAKKLASKTLERYRQCADLRIIPWIGDIKLRELKRSDLQAFYKRIVEVWHLDNVKPEEKSKDGKKLLLNHVKKLAKIQLPTSTALFAEY